MGLTCEPVTFGRLATAVMPAVRLVTGLGPAHHDPEPVSFDSLASFHSLNVECCVLQHPSTVKPHDLVGRHKVVSVFCEDGLPGVHALTATAVA